MDCHLRLRQVTTLALQLAARPTASPDEVREVADKVRRYFTLVLPLHEEDEEASLFPRLLLRAPELAATVSTLRADHSAHDLRVGALVAVGLALKTSPERFPQVREVLGTAAEALSEAWSVHLAIEERDLFPAVRTALSEVERAAIREEMRARRAHLPR